MKKNKKKRERKKGEKRRVVEARASLTLVTRGPVQSSLFVDIFFTKNTEISYNTVLSLKGL